MKSTFLAKLQRNGLYCTTGALLLLVGIPLYQFLILIPSGYSNALATQSLALHWINTHSLLFLGYRALLFASFAFIISMPFTLFRIIVAQEILGREANEQEEDDKEDVVQDEAKDQSDNHHLHSLRACKDTHDNAFPWRESSRRLVLVHLDPYFPPNKILIHGSVRCLSPPL